MVDRDLVASKLSELADHLTRVRARRKAAAAELARDRDALDLVALRDQGVISAPVSDALARAVGLRNVVAHGYAGVRPEIIHAAATAGLADLEAFSREVAAWTQRQEAS